MKSRPVTDLSRYARQLVYPGIGETGQRKLLASRMAVIGIGALGTVIANNLARAGVGYLRLVDRDFVEWSNLQRQTLFDETDAAAGAPKAVAAAERLNRINSLIDIEPCVVDLTPENVQDIIDDVDVVVDGTDNFETRYVINDACVKWNKPWVYSGVVAAYGMSMTIVPGQTACLRCVYPEPAPAGRLDTCDTAGVLNGAAGLIASLASTEAIKLVVGNGILNDGLIHADVWTNTYERFSLSRRPGCLTCDRGEYHFLDGQTSETATLCGRDAVQVRPLGKQALDLADLGERLAGVGPVQVTPFLLRLSVDNCEVTLFPDARAIIKGTDEPSVARAIYSKYIGM